MIWSPLHGHTVYSDGVQRPEDVALFAKEAGFCAVGITDHGTMAGTYLSRCVDSPLKVIAGVEIYHNDSNDHREGKRYHLTLIALNDMGFTSLCKANLYAWEHFYRHPIVTLDYLLDKKNWRGVVCLTGCPASKFAVMLRDGDVKGAEEWLLMLRSAFDEVYVEVQGGSEIQDSYSKDAMRLAKRCSLKPIATSDYHYNNNEDRIRYEMLVMAKGMMPNNVDLRLERVPDTEAGREGILNAVDLANRVSYSRIPVQKISSGVSVEVIESFVMQEAQKRNLDDKYLSQIRYELDVMKKLDVMWYIGVLWQICRQMRERGFVFEARGSASASVVLWLLGITHLDPIKHGLLFDRFMSVKRRELPDVDLDVCASQRDNIVQCVRDMGWNVAKILTSNTLTDKGVSRAAERIRRIKPDVTDAEISMLNGAVYNTGVHASGMVLWPKGTDCVVPLRWCDGDLVVEYENKYLPYIKFDLLGQKTLDVLVDVVRRSDGSSYESVRDMVVNDPMMVFKSLQDARVNGCLGVFQLEGSMSKFFRRVRCSSLMDIANVISVYRPAVLASGYAEKIANRESAPEHIAKHCMSGYPIYQEDLMRILVNVADVELSDAYTIVKLAAKKGIDAIADVVARLKSNLLNRGLSDSDVEDVLKIVAAFFGYGFNLSHAVAYAVRAAVSLVLRYRYWRVFWETLLRHETDNVMLANYLAYLSRFVSVMPPIDEVDFCMRGDKLFVGLSTFKGIGREDAEHISMLTRQKVSLLSLLAGLYGKVSATVIKSLAASGLIEYWYGVSQNQALELWENFVYNCRHKKKKRIVHDTVRFNPDISRIDSLPYSLLSQRLSGAGLPYYIPKSSVGFVSRDMVHAVVVKRSSNRFVLVGSDVPLLLSKQSPLPKYNVSFGPFRVSWRGKHLVIGDVDDNNELVESRDDEPVPF